MPDSDGVVVPELAVKPIRLRDGESAAAVDGAARVVHLVARTAVLDGTDVVQACCGARFTPGAVQEVPWGALWPHERCVRGSVVDRSVLEQTFQVADPEWPDGSEEEWTSSFQAVEKLLKPREDWINDDESQDWVYNASLNGVLVGECRFPRSVDVGLDPLSAELVRPHVFRIHSCGVRDGCPKHVNRSETFSLDDVHVITERVTVLEHAALSVDLQELAWCLIFGACSQSTLTLMLR